MRLLLVEDYRFIRNFICTLLASIPGAEVVAQASSGEEAVALARDLRPDVVLMDISLEGMNGLVATETIRRELPEVRVLIVSRHMEAEYVLLAFRAGACGYLPKCGTGAELGLALAALERGEAWFSPSLPHEEFDYCAQHLAGNGEPRARQWRESITLAAAVRSNQEDNRETVHA